jgi:hypothetical protein
VSADTLYVYPTRKESSAWLSGFHGRGTRAHANSKYRVTLGMKTSGADLVDDTSLVQFVHATSLRMRLRLSRTMEILLHYILN